MIIIYVNFS